MFSSLEYRLHKEKNFIKMIPTDWTIVFSMHSTQGFTNHHNDVKLTKLTKPTWHYGGDWNE